MNIDSTISELSLRAPKRRRVPFLFPALAWISLMGAAQSETQPLPNDFFLHFSFDASTLDSSKQLFQNPKGSLRLLEGNGVLSNGKGRIAEAAEFGAGLKPSCRIAAAGVGVGDLDRDSFSISFWFSTVSEARLQMLVTKGRTDAAPSGYNISLGRAKGSGQGQVIVTLSDGETPTVQKSFSSAFPEGNWTHLVLVVDRGANSATIFLDGVAVNAVDGNSIPPELGSLSSGFELNFGTRYPFGDLPFNGALDDFGLWKRALSPSEVESIYTAGLKGQGLE